MNDVDPKGCAKVFAYFVGVGLAAFAGYSLDQWRGLFVAGSIWLSIVCLIALVKD